MTAQPLLDVRGLTVALRSGAPIVDSLDLHLERGEILGLVGESGSGKTTTALALLGFTRAGTKLVAGQVHVAGQSLLALTDKQQRHARGRLISYVPQDAAQALNPALRVRAAIADVMRQRATAPEGHDDVHAALAAVDLPATASFDRRLPHQLSGGQQQRVTIAMALSCRPPVVVMDEPTTGLDVVTQASVLDEVRSLSRETGAAVVYVSHDLAVVSQLADRVAVMYAGRIVEEGPASLLLSRPRHPYTRGLVQSIPDHRRPSRLIAMPGTAAGVDDRPPGCAFAPRCPQRSDQCDVQLPALTTLPSGQQVRCVHADRTPPPELGEPRSRRTPATATPVLEVAGLAASHRSGTELVRAAQDVSFVLGQGECLALVGESGSGKTTIARSVVGLHRPDGGAIVFRGATLAPRIRARSVEQRRAIQYVFQNPFQSLNPRRRVRDDLARAAQVLRGLSAAQARDEVTGLLERVRLPARLADRYPHQLSGGERQRVAIARGLAAHPTILICDEITSALDVSVQAAILDVLAVLRDELALSMLLITHDLGVVASVADRVLVLRSGIACETGSVDDVLSAPSHDYTQRLIGAAPTLLTATSEVR